jgi:hypothetical protein
MFRENSGARANVALVMATGVRLFGKMYLERKVQSENQKTNIHLTKPNNAVMTD